MAILTPDFPLTDDTRARVSVEPGMPRPLARVSPRKRKKKERRHAATKVAFPRYGYYDIAFRFFTEQVLNADFVALPEPTKRTLERGSLNSSDFVCAPFKHILGDYIDALELGADVLVQFSGPCRLGYYGELQESILRDAGYDFDMLNFAAVSGKPLKDYISQCKRIVNPDLSVSQGVKKFVTLLKMVECLDSYNDVFLARAGLEADTGSFKKARESYFAEMRGIETLPQLNRVHGAHLAALKDLALKPGSEKAVRVGIIGDYFTAVDPFSNLFIENKFIDLGVSLARLLNLTSRNLRYNEPNLRRGVSEYVSYDMGPTSTLNIAAAKRYAEEGFDGLVHLKSTGCTPEIDVMPVLQRISRDYHIPVLYLSFDSQTSDAGLDTRLEAFYDMISMRKAHS